jgi:diguanylate cyclase (GGDEF)-like protein
MEIPEGMVRVTLSLGAATRDKETTVDVSSHVRAADQALYRAKEKGRNRIEMASD